MEDRDIDAKLARLARDTTSLKLRGDFAAQVLVAIQAEQARSKRGNSDLWSDLPRAGRRFVPFAALAAAAAVAWAIHATHVVDDALADSIDGAEVEW